MWLAWAIPARPSRFFVNHDPGMPGGPRWLHLHSGLQYRAGEGGRKIPIQVHFDTFLVWLENYKEYKIKCAKNTLIPTLWTSFYNNQHYKPPIATTDTTNLLLPQPTLQTPYYNNQHYKPHITTTNTTKPPITTNNTTSPLLNFLLAQPTLQTS